MSGARSSKPLARSAPRPHRGGISKSGGAAARLDKDGDSVMDAAGAKQAGRGSGSGRGAASRGQGAKGRQQTPDSLASRLSSRTTRSGLDPSVIQKAVLRNMGSSDLIPKSRLKSIQGRDKGRPQSDKMGRIRVLGLKDSKAASNPDGGIADLIAFLERKSSHPDAAAKDAVKIKKSRMDGDALIVSVRQEDIAKISRIDGYTFAGTNIKIEELDAQLESTSDSKSETTPKTVDILKSVLHRRYNLEAKLLDLSHLGSDPELVTIGMFDATTTESKFFPALMKVCNSIFKSAKEKEDAVLSVTLSNNALVDISSVTALAQTFPDLRNLDLSTNNIQQLKALEGWRWRFRKLEQLVLSPNPIDTSGVDYKQDLMKWYPALMTLNGSQIRSPEEIKASLVAPLPLPVSAPSFRDEAAIGQNFLQQFFLGYDTDRPSLVGAFYDSQSTFSLSVNTSAPRGGMEATGLQAAGWDQYIKRSRNLLRLTHLAARMSRMYTGIENIKECFSTLPATKHPDIGTEPQKWCIECHAIPGLPDPANRSSPGLGGMTIMVHGEFSEVDVSTNASTAIRSFDRTFALGPGGGLGGIRVVCDSLMLRAYGGCQAWIPEESNAQSSEISTGVLPTGRTPGSQGLGLANIISKEEQALKESFASQLSQVTGMTLEYSAMCLEQSGWNLDSAARVFQQAKANLPADAFIHQK